MSQKFLLLFSKKEVLAQYGCIGMRQTAPPSQDCAPDVAGV
jgi:hypothetical protein